MADFRLIIECPAHDHQEHKDLNADHYANFEGEIWCGGDKSDADNPNLGEKVTLIVKIVDSKLVSLYQSGLFITLPPQIPRHTIGGPPVAGRWSNTLQLSGTDYVWDLQPLNNSLLELVRIGGNTIIKVYRAGFYMINVNAFQANVTKIPSQLEVQNLGTTIGEISQAWAVVQGGDVRHTFSIIQELESGSEIKVVSTNGDAYRNSSLDIFKIG